MERCQSTQRGTHIPISSCAVTNSHRSAEGEQQPKVREAVTLTSQGASGSSGFHIGRTTKPSAQFMSAGVAQQPPGCVIVRALAHMCPMLDTLPDADAGYVPESAHEKNEAMLILNNVSAGDSEQEQARTHR